MTTPVCYTAPVQKLVRNLARFLTDGAKEESKESREVCVLLTTGSYAPPHRMHTEIMEAAKRHLEREGNVVVAGFFSPSHDGYVKQKLGADNYITAQHRVALCKLATDSSDWLDCISWEALEKRKPSGFNTVFQELRDSIQEQQANIANDVLSAVKSLCPSSPLSERDLSVIKWKMVYVCGEDLAVRCGFHADLMSYLDMPMLIVVRPGTAPMPQKQVENLSQSAFVKIVNDESIFDVSSTLIRRYIKHEIPIDDLVHEPCREYIKQHNLLLPNQSNETDNNVIVLQTTQRITKYHKK